ncbi:MAG TPA: hypothetical protein VHR64_02375 [Thermomicrobiales bacterium]|nr:hypothetical protein [Thermomicrobiales bacterium]
MIRITRAKGKRNGREHEIRIIEGREIDPDDAAGKLHGHPAGGCKRQSRFSDASCPGKRNEARFTFPKRRFDCRNFPFSSDKRCRWEWERICARIRRRLVQNARHHRHLNPAGAGKLSSCR